MKKLLLLVALLFTCSRAHALVYPALTYQTAVSSATTFQVAVSSLQVSGAGTQMDNPTLTGRVIIEVQNVDTALNLYCGFNVAESSTTARKIAPGASWVVSILDRLQQGGSGSGLTAAHIYCINDGTTGTTRAAVTQMY